jgi:hypothetical protein
MDFLTLLKDDSTETVLNALWRIGEDKISGLESEILRILDRNPPDLVTIYALTAIWKLGRCELLVPSMKSFLKLDPEEGWNDDVQMWCLTCASTLEPKLIDLELVKLAERYFRNNKNNEDFARIKTKFEKREFFSPQSHH